MFELQRRVDSLSPVPQTVVYLGLAVVTYLLLIVALVLTGTPVPSGQMGFFWVLMLTAGGVSGSRFRTRNRTRSQG